MRQLPIYNLYKKKGQGGIYLPYPPSSPVNTPLDVPLTFHFYLIHKIDFPSLVSLIHLKIPAHTINFSIRCILTAVFLIFNLIHLYSTLWKQQIRMLIFHYNQTMYVLSVFIVLYAKSYFRNRSQNNIYTNYILYLILYYAAGVCICFFFLL